MSAWVAQQMSRCWVAQQMHGYRSQPAGSLGEAAQDTGIAEALGNTCLKDV